MDLLPNFMMLFTNKKKTASQPDMKGEAHIVCPHCQKESTLEVVLWGKTAKNGNPFLSGSIKQPEENEWTKKKAEYAQQKKEEAQKIADTPIDKQADDLPF